MYVGSAAPWEVLLARTEVQLLRSPRISISQHSLVDTPAFFDRRSSPRITGERFEPGYSQFEYTRGMIHPSADPKM